MNVIMCSKSDGMIQANCYNFIHQGKFYTSHNSLLFTDSM